MGWQDAPEVTSAAPATGWASAPLVDATPQPAPVNDFSGTLRLGNPLGGGQTFDTGITLPDAVNKRLANWGSGIDDLLVGAKGLFASDKHNTLSSLVTGQTESDKVKAEVGEKRKLDSKLNDDFVGKLLNFGGNVAPTLMIPGGWAGALGRAAPIVEGVAAGALQGAVQPVAQGESRVTNTALGGALGGVVPGVVQGVRSLAAPAGQASDLARTAIDTYGIPLGAADITSNRMVKGARSVLNDVPIIGGIGTAQNTAKQAAYNRAVGNVIGAPADQLTPAVMQGARTQISGELDRIWNNNNFRLDPQFVTDLGDIGQRLQSLKPQQAQEVNNQIQILLQRVSPTGEIPGNFVNNFQSELRLMVDGEKGLHKSVLQDLRTSVLDAFNRNVTGPDAQALAQARSQWGAYKTLEPLMAKGEVGVAGRAAGDVPAALLPNAVFQQYGARAGQSPFGELPAIGSRFIADRVPQMGGTPRALIQNSALGGALGMGAYASPLTAGLGAGAGAVSNWALGSPMLGRALLNAAPRRGAGSQTQLAPALREMLMTTFERAPVPFGIGMLTVPQEQ